MIFKQKRFLSDKLISLNNNISKKKSVDLDFLTDTKTWR